jgi:hypothetical protein
MVIKRQVHKHIEAKKDRTELFFSMLNEANQRI